MRAEERLRVLTTVMRAFATATTDLDALLDVIARNLAEVLGDACVVLILNDDRTRLVPIAAHAVDPEALARAHALVAAEPMDLATHPAAKHVLETRGSLLVAHIDPSTLPATTSAFAQYQKEQGIHSLLAVALHAQDEPLGLLTLTRYRPTSPPFDPSDKELALNLAVHASLALVNARLYVAEKEARVAAEEAIRSRLAAEAGLSRLRALIEALPDAILVTNETRRIRIINHCTERLLGYTRAELEDAPLDVVLPEPTRARRKDGSELSVDVTVNEVVSDEGMLVVTALRDVTERRKTEERAETAHRELERFSYTVAHDLRTPLRGINGFARILLEDNAAQLDGDGRTLLEKIAKNAAKMGKLIDGLLDLARLTRTALKREEVDLSAVFRATLEDAARPDTEIVIAENLVADADPALVQALAENLVANAVKFTAKSEEARIELGQRTSENGEPIYFFRDNGAGFDMQFANQLFKPFHRLHHERDFAGTGIGLATVERIVTRHGGRIWAEGRVGEGATFFFTLPKVHEAH